MTDSVTLQAEADVLLTAVDDLKAIVIDPAMTIGDIVDYVAQVQAANALYYAKLDEYYQALAQEE